MPSECSGRVFRFSCSAYSGCSFTARFSLVVSCLSSRPRIPRFLHHAANRRRILLEWLGCLTHQYFVHEEAHCGVLADTSRGGTRAILRYHSNLGQTVGCDKIRTASHAVSTAPARHLRKVRSGPLRLRILGVAHSTKFTKTLYVRCTPNKSLKQLVTDLGGDPNELLDPHVSLLYKRLPASMRRELAASIKLPFREINFDQIKTVSCNSPTETHSDVRSWRV